MLAKSNKSIKGWMQETCSGFNTCNQYFNEPDVLESIEDLESEAKRKINKDFK